MHSFGLASWRALFCSGSEKAGHWLAGVNPGGYFPAVRRPLHHDELAIDAELVRKLVDANFPQYRALPIAQLGRTGSSNVLFRLGEDLLVRLPRQPGGGAGIAKELQWLPSIRVQLPVAIPEITGIGRTGFGYTEPWVILRWLEGHVAARREPDAAVLPSAGFLADGLADFILALRAVPIPSEALADNDLQNYRGQKLASFDPQMRKNIGSCREIDGLGLDLGAVESMWSDALAMPYAAATPPNTRWFHGDLVAENLLLCDGQLSAVLDFGEMGIGDPAVDLHGAWELFDRADRERFRARLNAEEGEWLRGRAWALAVGIATIPYYWDTMQRRVSDRRVMVKSALADWAQN